MAVDITYAAAAGGGLLSFLSPCVLPLVPSYLCFIAGASLDDLVAQDGRDQGTTRRVVLAALAFVLGFSTVFVALGASASAIHALLFEHIDVIGKVAGALIIVLGIHYIGIFRIPFLDREARMQVEARPVHWLGAYVVGLAFAFGWTPCIGPILATILTVAATQDSLGYGVSLLATYAAGLGIPFLLAALALRPFLRFAARFRRHLKKVEIAAGLMMVVTGVMIITNTFSQLGLWLLEWFPALGSIG
ncbi:MAG: cytochrome c biogenesis protein CcdA [Alphaproteobacteria bacterium]|jgi:cytochrome c-type biogenesis protein|nr:cytochrome c biogenesis protein CcdA [Alphaproteobacteria bacterium]